MAQRQQRPCNPKQQLFEGKPGAILVCPDCRQAMPGIPYEYGTGLLTLPIHYDPFWTKKSFPVIRSQRAFQRRAG